MNCFRRPAVELERLLSGPETPSEKTAEDAGSKTAQLGTGDDDMNMILTKRKVMVKQVPGTAHAKERQKFLLEIHKCVAMDRPLIVLDCSNLCHLNSATACLLIQSLEEAMKRNGDVKLAALPAGAEAVLELTGLGRVFEVYGTVEEAKCSFHELPNFAVGREAMDMQSPQESESVA